MNPCALMRSRCFPTRCSSNCCHSLGAHPVSLCFFAGAASSLPRCFQYACACCRLRHVEFGGGAFVVTQAGIRYHSTSDILRAGLDDTPAEEGRSGFVLATRDPEHGLSFWNNETGFGRLAEATVFSEAEAAAFDKPIAHDEPEWLACPAGSPVPPSAASLSPIHISDPTRPN